MYTKIIGLTASIAILTFAAPAMAASHGAGDVTKGQKVFKKCMSCHEIGEGAKSKVGPPLTGIIGRKAAAIEGYKYGKSIVAAGEAGLVWSEEELDEYLLSPKKYLRAKLGDKKAKSKMPFRLKKEQDRADVIAYLSSLSE